MYSGSSHFCMIIRHGERTVHGAAVQKAVQTAMLGYFVRKSSSSPASIEDRPRSGSGRRTFGQPPEGVAPTCGPTGTEGGLR